MTNHIALIVCLLLGSFCFAQNEEPIPLDQVLKSLEQRYDSNFSYLDADIEGVMIALPKASFSFRESITYLKRRLPLKFTILEDKQVTISKLPQQNTICGILVDEEGRPLFGATIQMQTTAIVSDDDGFFSIPLSSSDDMIKISFTGYKKQEIAIDSLKTKPCSTIVLETQIQALNEIIITDYLAKGIDRKSDGGIQIDFSEMALLPGVIESDVLLTAQALPGIQSVNERVSDLNIRGGTHDQNLILWDGIKMYQSGHFFGLISSVNPNLTEKVVVYKNGSPARYTDGVSGILEMQSAREITDSLQGALEVNLINAGGFLDIPLGKKSSIQLSARKSLSDILETPTYTEYFNRIFQDTEVIRDGTNTTTDTDEELFSFYDTSLRWLYKPTEKDEIQMNGLIVKNELSFRETAFIDQIRERQSSSASQNNLAGSLSYKRDWSSTFSTFAQIYATNYTLNATNFDLANSQRLIQTNDVLENALRIEGLLNPNIRTQWTAGYQFVETGITNVQDVNNPLFRQSIKEVIRAHGVYGVYDYSTQNSGSRFVFGLRGQYYDKLDAFRVEPRLHYSQRLGSGLTLEADAELKSQATSQTIDIQSDFLGIESRRWILANNSNIPLVESMQLSAGLTFNRDKWLISAEAYYKMVDGITLNSQGFQNQLQFVQGTGSYETKGLDFLIHKRWERFNFRTGYAIAFNDYNFDELPNDIETRFPNNVDLRHSIKTAFAYTGNRLRLAAGVNWHTGKPTTNLVSSIPVLNSGLNYETPNNVNLSGYVRVDASAQYTFDLGNGYKAELLASVWNVLNNENIVNQYFLLSNEQPTTIRERALRFTPNISLKIRYN